MPEPSVSLNINADLLRPLIREVVAATLAEIAADQAKLGDKLAYSEPEAAALLGLEPHVLRDERRRGRIGASSIVGRRVRYTKDDLLGYLAGRRVT